MPQKGVKTKPRPEISQPILIKSKSEDHSSKFALPKPASDVDLRKLRDLYETRIQQSSSNIKIQKKVIEKRRNLSGQIPVTEHEKYVKLRSMPNEPHYDITNQEKRATMYDEGDYVVLQFPFAEPGKVIRTDPLSGKIEQLSKEKVILKESLSSTNKNKETKQCTDCPSSSSHSLPKAAWFGSKEAIRPRIPSKPAVDDDGYEAPLIFQRPVYMTLDFAASPPECESNFTGYASTPTDSSIGSPSTSAEKPVYKKESACNQLPETKTRSEQASENVSNQENPSKPSFLFSLSNESSIRKYDEDKNPTDNTKDSVGKPINSFLASRLELASLKSDDSDKNRTVSAESWTSATLSSPFSDPGNDYDDEDEWSSSSDFSTDSECYYQQIEPPDLSGHTSDHDYAMIDDCHTHTNQHIKRRKAKRSKSVKKAISLVVNGRTKSTESNKSPHTTPKLQRSNMQDMRTGEAGSSTWDTVSTPGILKLNNFKDLGKNK